VSEATHFHLKPVEGRLVRDPKTQAKLSADGERKPRNSYWIRRLRAGDVVKYEPEPVAKAPIVTEESKTDG
jgi:hypothetical protein